MVNQSEKKFDDTLHKIAKSAEKIKSKSTKKKGNKDMKNKSTIITVVLTLAFVALMGGMFALGVHYKTSQEKAISQAVQERLEQSKAQR